MDNWPVNTHSALEVTLSQLDLAVLSPLAVPPWVAFRFRADR